MLAPLSISGPGRANFNTLANFHLDDQIITVLNALLHGVRFNATTGHLQVWNADDSLWHDVQAGGVGVGNVALGLKQTGDAT